MPLSYFEERVRDSGARYGVALSTTRPAIGDLSQNSLDAVRVRRIEESKLKPAIVVHFDADHGILEITDNGIGMDLDVIRRHFLKVGDSYYRSAAF